MTKYFFLSLKNKNHFLALSAGTLIAGTHYLLSLFFSYLIHRVTFNCTKSPHTRQHLSQSTVLQHKLYILYISYLLHLYDTALNVSISFHYCPLLSSLRVNTFCSNIFYAFKREYLCTRGLFFRRHFLFLVFFFFSCVKAYRVTMRQPTHCIDRKEIS